MQLIFGVLIMNSSLDDNGIRSSIGIGFDWFSPLGPINFSLAYQLQRK